VEEIGTVWAAIAVIYVLQLYEDDAARNWTCIEKVENSV
jgi:replication initiation protein RepC